MASCDTLATVNRELAAPHRVGVTQRAIDLAVLRDAVAADEDPVNGVNEFWRPCAMQPPDLHAEAEDGVQARLRDAAVCTDIHTRIRATEQALRFAGWSRSQAKADASRLARGMEKSHD